MGYHDGTPRFHSARKTVSKVAVLALAFAALSCGSRPPSVETQRQAAERAAGDWINAYREADVARLVSLSETPFYWSGELLLSREASEAAFRKILAAQPNYFVDVEVKSIRARTIGELKNERKDIQDDPVFKSMSFGDADWGIEVNLQKAGKAEGLMMFARMVEGQPRLVGAWQ